MMKMRKICPYFAPLVTGPGEQGAKKKKGTPAHHKHATSSMPTLFVFQLSKKSQIRPWSLFFFLLGLIVVLFGPTADDGNGSSMRGLRLFLRRGTKGFGVDKWTAKSVPSVFTPLPPCPVTGRAQWGFWDLYGNAKIGMREVPHPRFRVLFLGSWDNPFFLHDLPPFPMC